MPNETYECILTGTIAGQFCQSILHVNVNNTASTDPFTVADALIEEFNDSGNLVELYCNCLPVDYFMTSLRVRRVLAAGGPTNIMLQAALSNSQGNRSGACQSASAGPLIIWMSDLRPAKTGRTFLPGASVSDVEGGAIDNSLLVALTAFAAYWQNGGTLASPSYAWAGAILRRALGASDDINHARVSPIIGTQRRRQRPI